MTKHGTAQVSRVSAFCKTDTLSTYRLISAKKPHFLVRLFVWVFMRNMRNRQEKFFLRTETAARIAARITALVAAGIAALVAALVAAVYKRA